MKQPNILRVRNLVEQANAMQQKVPPGVAWVPARPSGYPGFWNRIRAAWLVFTGRADAILWEAGQ